MTNNRDLLDLIIDGEDLIILCEWLDKEGVDYYEPDIAKQVKMIRSALA